MPVGEPLFLSAASSEGHEAFVRATVVAQRTDGSLRVRTDGNKERVCRLGVDAWPAGETEAPASSSLLNVAYLHTYRTFMLEIVREKACVFVTHTTTTVEL